jgi:VWFA-related protein
MPRDFWGLLLMGLAALAQQSTQTGDGIARFQANSQLVIEAVTITDRSGKPIEGLTPKDFTVTEDGVPQAISICEFQGLQNGPEPLAEARHERASASGGARYRDRRLLALYFDLSTMPPPDQMRAQRAASRFITDRMTPRDMVAIISFSDVVRVRQDFTDDREQLLRALNKLFLGETHNWLSGSVSDDSTADYGSAFGEDDSEFNLFTIDRQLAALQTAVNRLGKLSEKKALIYFASGLRLNGLGNQAQLAATTNAAIRANVSIYTVDSRGLVAEPPLGDATQGSQGGLAMYTGASAISLAGNLQRSQDTLYALAADTGGRALLDNNELALGIVNAQKAITSYYILGYYTTNPALDGRFRRVRIAYNGETTAKLDYRHGYYAGKQFSQFTAADKERQLQDALMLGDPITDLTIATEVNYFQLNSAEYFVPVAVKIPGSELVLARRRGAERTVIDFIGEVKDESDVTVANVRDKVEMSLTGQTAAELAKRPVQYDTGFTLLPGTYSLKLLARDAETGRIGTYLTRFDIPNLNKEERRIPISSVVISGQRVDVKDALYTVGRTKGSSVSPLVVDGKKLIPSVTRVFRGSRDLYVYLQAYRVGASAAQPLFAFITLYRGQANVLAMPPFAFTEATENRLKTVSVLLSLSLETLHPGRYTCQVTVLEPNTRKAAFWQSRILIVP